MGGDWIQKNEYTLDKKKKSAVLQNQCLVLISLHTDDLRAHAPEMKTKFPLKYMWA